MSFGTIQVDLDTLPGVISAIQSIHDNLQGEQSSLTTIVGAGNGSLAEAVSGTAPNIASFESNLDTTLSALNSAVGTLGTALTALNKVLADAQDAANTQL